MTVRAREVCVCLHVCDKIQRSSWLTFNYFILVQLTTTHHHSRGFSFSSSSQIWYESQEHKLLMHSNSVDNILYPNVSYNLNFCTSMILITSDGEASGFNHGWMYQSKTHIFLFFFFFLTLLYSFVTSCHFYWHNSWEVTENNRNRNKPDSNLYYPFEHYGSKCQVMLTSTVGHGSDCIDTSAY